MKAPICAILAFGLLAAGCGGSGRERPPPTEMFVVNAAPTYSGLDFYRVERREAALAYHATERMVFDEDTYRFSVRKGAESANSDPIATFSESLSSQSSYLVVLTEIAGLVEPVVLDRPAFDDASPDVEFSLFHAGPSTSPVDFYIEAPDTDLATAVPRGSASFLDEVPPFTIEPGEYVVSLTEVGNPANILFNSSAFTAPAGQSFSLVITDGANDGLSTIVIVAASASPGLLVDDDLRSAMRVLNGIADGAPRDIYVGEDFTAPWLAAAPGRALSELTPIGRGTRTLSVTPVGNPGTIELEDDAIFNASVIYTLLLTGEAGAVEGRFIPEGFRPLRDYARVRVYNAVNAYDRLEVFITLPETDIDKAIPFAQLAGSSANDRLPFEPGSYVVTVRDMGTRVNVQELIPLTLEEFDVVSIFLVDNPDGTTVDVLIVDETQ